MPKTAMDRGPNAERVAYNVRALRKARDFDLADLSERLRDLGRPISVSALSKLELGTRGIDVDDLVALAVALDVTPNRLLLSENADQERIVLVGDSACSTRAAWRWAAGDEELRYNSAPSDAAGPVLDLDRLSRFNHENRPHDPPDDTSLQQLRPHREKLAQVLRAVAEVEEQGISRRAVFDYVDLTRESAALLVAGRPGTTEQEGGDDGQHQ